MTVLLRERIEQFDARCRKVPDVARDQDEIMNQRCSRDLLVERILGMRHAQPTPNLRHIRVEGKNAVAEIVKQPAQPAFERLRLPGVSSMTNEFDPAPQFADRQGSDIKRSIARGHLFEECNDPPGSPSPSCETRR